MTDIPALAGLTTLLGSDPIVAAATGGSGRSVAVPMPARALFGATLAAATARRPVVLAVPTGVEAERLAADLREFLGADAVELFPAWETPPFERVSPAVETMGRRLRVIWRLRTGQTDPTVLPAVVVVKAESGQVLGHETGLLARGVANAGSIAAAEYTIDADRALIGVHSHIPHVDIIV